MTKEKKAPLWLRLLMTVMIMAGIGVIVVWSLWTARWIETTPGIREVVEVVRYVVITLLLGVLGSFLLFALGQMGGALARFVARQRND